jgi:hypothetical protein
MYYYEDAREGSLPLVPWITPMVHAGNINFLIYFFAVAVAAPAHMSTWQPSPEPGETKKGSLCRFAAA